MINTVDHNISLDLVTGVVRVSSDIKIKRQDTLSHKFNLTLTEAGVAYNLTGLTARIFFTKGDGNVVYEDCTVDNAAGGLLSSILNTQCLTYPGFVHAEVTIFGTTGEILTSPSFAFRVLNVDRDDEAIESTSVFPIFDSKLNDLAINVRDFGAVLDGVTDDSAAINAAIAALPIDGTLLIKGNAKVISAIVMKSNITVICKGSIIGTNQARVIDFYNVNDSNWLGGDISGDSTNVSQTGIYARGANRCKISPDSISGCQNKGILLQATSAVGDTCRDNIIEIIKIIGCISSTGAGIGLNGDTCEHNIIKGGYYTTNRVGISINSAHRNKVIAPDCSGNTIAGLMIDGTVSDSGDGGKYNKVISPVCNNNGSGSTAYAGLYLGNGSNYNKITAPTCNNNTGSGIKLNATQGVNECVGNIIVAASCEGNGNNGLNIANSSRNILVAPIAKANTGNGIYVFKADYTQIIGGEAADNTQVGIKVLSGYTRTLGVKITGNVGVGYQTAAGGSADSSNNIISGGSYVAGNGTQFSLAGLGRISDSIGATRTVADAGDTNYSYSLGLATTIIYATPIMALRSVTLSTTNALNGDKIRVIRAASCTGAFNINVGTGPLKALTAAGQWCDVEYNGTAWVLTGYGTL